MSFTSEQSEEIKKQLLEQIEKLPNENKDQIKEYIKSLDEKGLEEFLKQNKIQISETGQLARPENHSSEPDKPIFESIVKGEIPSYNITENDKAIAILEINPFSKGHSIILPKQKTTIEKLPKSAFSLAQKIAKRIKKKFKPDDIKIETFLFQDYPAINIIPIYKDVPLKKQKAEDEELKKIQKKLETKKRSPRKSRDSSTTSPSKTKPTISKKLSEISFRIP